MERTSKPNAAKKLQDIMRYCRYSILSRSSLPKQRQQGLLPGEPSVFIRLTAMEEFRVLFAIEVCAQRIADEMYGHFEKFGVNWHDEHLPQTTKEARNLNEL